MAWTTSLFPSSHALLNKREKCVNTSYVPTFCQKGKIFIYSCRIFCPLKEELCNIEFFVVLVEWVLILIVEASGVCASPQQYHCHLAKKKYHCHLGNPPVFLILSNINMKHQQYHSHLVNPILFCTSKALPLVTPILSPRWKNLLRICGHLCLFRAILQSCNLWAIYLEQLWDKEQWYWE